MREGLVRAIGVSNFSIKKLREVLAFAEIKPVVNQVGGMRCRGAAMPCYAASLLGSRIFLYSRITVSNVPVCIVAGLT